MVSSVIDGSMEIIHEAMEIIHEGCTGYSADQLYSSINQPTPQILLQIYPIHAAYTGS